MQSRIPMAYTNTYNASDTSLVVVDLLVTIAVGFVSFATLIGLVLLWKLLKGKKML